MNYVKIYEQIVNKAKSENRTKGLGVYYERHHIIPKCMNGSNEKNNLILLTAKEHFICHKILCIIYPDNKKLIHALWRMINVNSTNRHRASAKDYEYFKLRKSIIQSKMVSAENNPMYGKKHTEQTKVKMRRPIKESTKKLISLKNKGKVAWNKNKKGLQTWSESQRQRMLEVVKRPKSAEHKKNLSISHTGKVMKVKTCEYCLKVISTTNYVRWHGLKCKNITNQ